MNVEVDDLAPLGALSGLRELILALTNPHEHIEHPLADLSPLRELAGLTKLEGVNLARTPVRDVSPLRGLTGLRWVNLSGSGVEDAQVAELRARLPELSILRDG